MEKVLHRADSRGFVEHGWLKSYHTFSFASYQNAARVRFGLFRVLNDDWIAPGKGFDTHPHENMEIITVPLKGALRHRDSMGNELVIRSGEIQRMSAGSGLTHSEYNHSNTEEVNLLQLWIFPKKLEVTPSYGQKVFDRAGRKNRFQSIVSPDEREGSIGINQDAFLSLAEINPGTLLNYELKLAGNGVYFFVIEGTIEIGGEVLGERDGLGLEGQKEIPAKAKTQCTLLAIEVPMTRNSH